MLEPGVELGFVIDPPVRKKGRQGAFGEDDEIAPAGACLAHLVHQASNDVAPGGLSGNGTALGRRDREEAWHRWRFL